jgi:pimeloyl-ACP methyl ester carboxylesterase
MWGREDEVTLLPYGERLARDMPNAKLVVYPQCGHFPMIEARGPSTADLVEFLAQDAP